MKYFIISIIAVIALAVIVGFFVIGSPKQERLRRFDERRISDLQTIQWQIINYWQNKNNLPQSLSDLNDNISGFRVPVDPEIGTVYEYVARGPLQFSLCATFAAETQKQGSLQSGVSVIPEYQPGFSPEYWNHGAGRTCFDRAIDKDFYKKKPSL